MLNLTEIDRTGKLESEDKNLVRSCVRRHVYLRIRAGSADRDPNPSEYEF